MENATNADHIKRQAVVIIHGIGEQRPMDTLRGFVKALLGEDGKKGRSYHSKPDTISDSYELRRIKLFKFKDPETGFSINDDWKYQTDFFEYYWAHHMSGTEWDHVGAWIWRILCRSWRDWRDSRRKDSENSKQQVNKPSKDHKRLRALYAWTWALIIVVLVVVLAFAIITPIVTITGVPAVLFALIVWFKFLPRLFLWRVKNTIGDAARYLDIAPANIARRYDILRDGKEMLHSLHNQTSRYTEKDKMHYVYDRIVIVGHSLGSIIAYDLLKHYWYEVNGRLPIEDRKAVEETEQFDCPPEGCPGIRQPHHQNGKLFWDAQYGLWKSLNSKWLGKVEFETDKAPCARWLITDFITLGSPLSYGTLLLAESVDDFKTKTELRELPICPPDRSLHIRPCQFVVPLDQEADVSAAKSFDILHHGAMFAVTRWTNFYFPNDLIAGEVTNVFGKGIRDISLTEGPNSWFRSHTSYWDPQFETCLDKLRTILKDVRWSERMVEPVSAGKSEALPPDRPGR